jgi:peptidoglycan-N-acetylglucosamine deacetylase
LNKHLPAAISVDVDTLASLYKGYGCRRPGGYTYADLRMGLERLARFLEPYQIRSTLFMVGNDFNEPANRSHIISMDAAGHEIANHTMTHAQGFRLLSLEEKEAEIAGMEEICEKTLGHRPIGFRSPGWNIGDDALPILKRRGYLYDSSVHPTYLMPLLKFLHWHSMSSCNRIDRTTMGHLKYMIAPIKPYHTSMRGFSCKGSDGIMEFPLTVTPFIRLPFFATFLLATGFKFFRGTYELLKALAHPIQFQFHLSDFVDYAHPALNDQVPTGRGVYVPQAFAKSLTTKLSVFQKAIDLIAKDYSFRTLEAWTREGGIEE